MAIRRCPYCKAIIEEGAEFCSNCGTQLLFPEDAKIEEEIPGEKIVDDDSDDDDEEDIVPLEVDNDVDPVEKDLLESSEKEEPLKEEEEKMGVAEAVPVEIKTDKSQDLEEVELEQETVEESEKEKDVSDDIHLEELEVENKEKELEEEIDLEEEWSEEKIHKHEEESEKINLDGKNEEEVIKEIEKETHSDSKEEGLRMEDLEKKMESSEIERQEIDKFIDSIRQDQGKDRDSIPFQKEAVEDVAHKDPPVEKEDVPEFVPHPEESQIIEEPIQEENVYEGKIVEDSPPLSSTPPLFEKQVIVPSTDELPAWASKINDEPPSNIPMTEEEKEFAPQEKIPTQDTGMGIPEVVAQKDLPFSGETLKAKEEKLKDPPSQFSAWLKSRIFDVLFIGGVWFISTWIASYVMEVKLFRLISAAALLLTAFYVVLLSAYLFLFFFFLGETIGDYLFNPARGSGFSRLS